MSSKTTSRRTSLTSANNNNKEQSTAGGGGGGGGVVMSGGWIRKHWVFQGALHIVHVNPTLQVVKALDIMHAMHLTHQAITSQILPLQPNNTNPYLVKAILRNTMRESTLAKDRKKITLDVSNSKHALDEAAVEKLLEFFLPKQFIEKQKHFIPDNCNIVVSDDSAHGKLPLIPHHLTRQPVRKVGSRRFSISRYTALHKGIDEHHRDELKEELDVAAGKKRKQNLLPPPSKIETRHSKKRRSMEFDGVQSNNAQTKPNRNVKSDGGKSTESASNGSKTATSGQSFTVLKPESIIWLAFTRYGNLNERICDEIEDLLFVLTSSTIENIQDVENNESSSEKNNEKFLWDVWYNVMQGCSDLSDETLRGFSDPVPAMNPLATDMCPVCKKNDLASNFLVCDGLIGPNHINHRFFDKGKSGKVDPPFFGHTSGSSPRHISTKEVYSDPLAVHFGQDCTSVTHFGPKGCMAELLNSKDLRNMLVSPEKCWFCDICTDCMNITLKEEDNPSSDSPQAVQQTVQRRQSKRGIGALTLDLSNCQMDQSTLFDLQARCLQIIYSTLQDPLGPSLYAPPPSDIPEEEYFLAPCLRNTERRLLLFTYLQTASVSDSHKGIQKASLDAEGFLLKFQQDIVDSFVKHLTDSDNVRLFKLYEGIMNAIADVRQEFVNMASPQQISDVKRFVLESNLLQFDRRFYMPLKSFYIFLQMYLANPVKEVPDISTPCAADASPIWCFPQTKVSAGIDLAVIRHVLKTDSDILATGVSVSSELNIRPRQYPRLGPPGFISYVDGPFVIGCDISPSALHAETASIPPQTTKILDYTDSNCSN